MGAVDGATQTAWWEAERRHGGAEVCVIDSAPKGCVFDSQPSCQIFLGQKNSNIHFFGSAVASISWM